jgi:hypothetical protein
MPERRSVVLACSFLMLGVVASAGAQSLADVARKEEARRKSISKPAKVYTNDDLKPVAPPSPSASSSGDTKPDAKAASDKDVDKSSADKAATTKETDDPSAKPAPTDQVKDQKYWASRLQALKDQLDRDQTYADALQTKINSLATDFVNRDDPAQRAQIARDKQKAMDELNRLKQAIQNDKKAITDLEEEARKAGVPPGWLRS